MAQRFRPRTETSDLYGSALFHAFLAAALVLVERFVIPPQESNVFLSLELAVVANAIHKRGHWRVTATVLSVLCAHLAAGLSLDVSTIVLGVALSSATVLGALMAAGMPHFFVRLPDPEKTQWGLSARHITALLPPSIGIWAFLEILNTAGLTSLNTDPVTQVTATMFVATLINASTAPSLGSVITFDQQNPRAALIPALLLLASSFYLYNAITIAQLRADSGNLLIQGSTPTATMGMVIALFFGAVIVLFVTEGANRRREAERTAESLRGANKKLTNANTLLSRFEKQNLTASMISAITHEVNTPLTTATLAAQDIEIRLGEISQSTALGPQEIEEVRESLESLNMLLKSVQSAGLIINNFRNLMTEREGNALAVVSASNMLMMVQSLVSPAMRGRNQELVLDADNHCVIQTRSAPLTQAIVNIVSNAYEHAFPNNEKGIVTVSVCRAEREAIITIEDDGVGLGENLKDTLFEIENNSPAREGKALGLYLSRSMIENLGGNLEYHAKSKGSRFVIKIPQD